MFVKYSRLLLVALSSAVLIPTAAGGPIGNSGNNKIINSVEVTRMVGLVDPEGAGYVYQRTSGYQHSRSSSQGGKGRRGGGGGGGGSGGGGGGFGSLNESWESRRAMQNALKSLSEEEYDSHSEQNNIVPKVTEEEKKTVPSSAPSHAPEPGSLLLALLGLGGLGTQLPRFLRNRKEQ